MENKDLFTKVSDGYDCEQVNQYINMLKAEYKKVFDYAKTVESNNEKLKNICRSLSDENKSLKASENKIVVADSGTNDISALIGKIEKLAVEISDECKNISENFNK